MTRNVITTTPDTSLAAAAAQMREHEVGALPVLDHGRLVGIITDRDISIKGSSVGNSLQNTNVRTVMTTEVISCFDDETIEHAGYVMEDRRVRRLVIQDRDGHVAGILSLDDIAVDTHDTKFSGEILARVAERAPARDIGQAGILVPLDGSELAEAVLPHVSSLAASTHAPITLLRVLGPLETIAISSSLTAKAAANETGSSQISYAPQDVRSDAITYLKAVQEELRRTGADVSVECQEGPVGDSGGARISETIVERARHLGSGLIAMSTHGRGSIGKAVFGSVTDAVVRSAPCPVMIVHPPAGSHSHRR